jgi:hypothetical protein
MLRYAEKTPGRRRTAATHLLFVFGARRRQVDADQLRSELRQDDRRADRAEDVGDGISDGNCIEVMLDLLGARPRRLIWSVATPIAAEIVCEPAYMPVA